MGIHHLTLQTISCQIAKLTFYFLTPLMHVRHSGFDVVVWCRIVTDTKDTLKYDLSVQTEKSDLNRISNHLQTKFCSDLQISNLMCCFFFLLSRVYKISLDTILMCQNMEGQTHQFSCAKKKRKAECIQTTI